MFLTFTTFYATKHGLLCNRQLDFQSETLFPPTLSVIMFRCKATSGTKKHFISFLNITDQLSLSSNFKHISID